MPPRQSCSDDITFTLQPITGLGFSRHTCKHHRNDVRDVIAAERRGFMAE